MYINLLEKKISWLNPLDLNEINFLPAIPDFEEFNW